MNIENSNEVIKFNIEHTLNGLNEQYNNWRKHVQQGDGMLYTLLGACLDFHNFLVREADYQSAFKGFCNFSWHKNTGLTTLIAKMVFGAKNKQTYTYIKALDAALAKGIGSNGAIGMEQWLKENGGINGVIRVDGGNSKAEVERNYRIRIAQEAEKFELKDKFGSLFSADLAGMIEHGSTDVVLLAQVDRKTGEFKVKWLSEEVSIRNKLWEIRGEAIMTTDAYRRNKDAYIESIREKNAEAAAKICEAFSKITSIKKIEQGVANISKVCVEV
ncbi:MAG: hypothetical protein RL671_69 [Pseudomonadota bacterium]|jgi:hypothetical protein